MLHGVKKCLVLAPHTDDGELGCGGTIARLIEGDVEVYYVAFSSCQESVPEGFDRNVLQEECHNATAVLGVSVERLNIEGFSVRRFPESRQEILQRMIELRKSIKPELILLPTQWDIHQDHRVIYEEGVRAFKFSSILGYELPWNTMEFSAPLFVKLSKEHLDKKILSIQEYKSQSHRPYSGDAMISLAKVRGLQSSNEYAEAFQVIRLMLN